MTTINDLVDDYEDYLRNERRLADGSVAAYLSDLRGLSVFVGDKPVADIEANDLRAYMRHLGRQGYKSTSIRRKMHGFGTFWEWLRLEKHVNDVTPHDLVLPRKPVRVVNWLNEHDLRRFVETPVNRHNPTEKQRDQLAWLLLAWLGLRRSELLNLEVNDVRLDENLIVIRDAKGQQDRVLPLPLAARPALILYLNGRTSGFLFLGRDGTQWKVQAFNRAFQRHLRVCGLSGKGITPHTLRHTFATHLVMAGVSVVVVSKLLGHKDIQSTMTYVHVGIEGMRAALNMFVLASRAE